MREILFRGKRCDNSEWIQGELVRIGNNTKIYSHKGAERHTVDPATVGQYTGLTDKNGTKIFEGDIVRYKTVYNFFSLDEVEESEKFRYSQGPVTFKEGEFSPRPEIRWCDDYWYTWGNFEFEVIGNIYENA